MTATKTHPNGGTFDSFLPVRPVFIFTRVSDMAVRILDTGLLGFPPLQLQSTGDPFVHNVNPALNIITEPGCVFVPGVVEMLPGNITSQVVQTFDELTIDGGNTVTHTICPTQQRFCVHVVTCENSAFKGACYQSCPVDCGDQCIGVPCVDTCAEFDAKCGPDCCIGYGVVACMVPPPLPACPAGDPCNCTAQPGACCDPLGFCTIVVEECECDAIGGRFQPGVLDCGPFGACCFGDGTCQAMNRACCTNLGGVFEGGNCDPPQECCFGTDCQMIDPECCTLLGGIPGPGMCDPPQSCCLPGGACLETDPFCCQIIGGMSLPGPCDPPRECCLPGGACILADPECCLIVYGGTPGVAGSICDPPAKCCMGDGTCLNAEPDCCFNVLMGTPFPGDLCDVPPVGCCFPNGNCIDTDAQCCQLAGGTPTVDLCEPFEACCGPTGGCTQEEPDCCLVISNGFADGVRMCNPDRRCCGGIYGGNQQDCVDDDPLCCTNRFGTPVAGACVAPEACCQGDLTCVMADPECCEQAFGGTAMGAGTSCSFIQACCLGNGTCLMLDPLCCLNILGTPQGIGSVCSPANQSCCFPNGTCQMLDPICCDDEGGIPGGPGSDCDNSGACCLDTNANGVPDACQVMAQDCCVTLGGTFQGAGTACGQVGACCYGITGGACENMPENCCDDVLGTFQGPGSMCLGDGNGDGSDDACGCVCKTDVNKNGITDIDDLLLALQCHCDQILIPNCDVNCDGVSSLTDIGAIVACMFNPGPGCCTGPTGTCTNVPGFGVCFEMSGPNCAAVGGTYGGDGTSCYPSPCDCDSNGRPDDCDIACGPPGGPCDIPGCGMGLDCDNDGILDSCEDPQPSCPCTTNLECDDGVSCTCDKCDMGTCIHFPVTFGDTSCDCIGPDLEDLICILLGFANYADCPNSDLANPECTPDGIIDVDDLILVLGAIAGEPSPCFCGPCTAACCYAGGVCTMESPFTCLDTSGDFQGAGTCCDPTAVCIPVTCP